MISYPRMMRPKSWRTREASGAAELCWRMPRHWLARKNVVLQPIFIRCQLASTDILLQVMPGRNSVGVPGSCAVIACL
jgi:hypothetical protein